MLANTALQTPDGDRLVEELRVGDLVYTHTLEPRKVLAVRQRPYKGKLVNLNTGKVAEAVSVSATQPVLLYDAAYEKKKHLLWCYAMEAHEQAFHDGERLRRITVADEDADDDVEMIDMWAIEVEKDRTVRTASGLVLYAGG